MTGISHFGPSRKSGLARRRRAAAHLGCILLGLLLTTVMTLATSFVPAYPQAAGQVAAQARPSVAFVLATGGLQTVSGSAFVVDPAGILVTALHVVADARVISVLLPGGRPQRADVLGVNVTDDLAVLRIPQTGLPALRLADASPIAVGQDVLVMGYPLSDVLGPYEATLTHGVVSAVRWPFVQLDASLDSGNSGGPVLNERGDVVGIAERGQGFNGAVAAAVLKALLTAAAAAAQHQTLMPLPLTTVRQVELTYRSGGIGGGGRREELAVSCLPPPAGARMLLAVHGELHAAFALDVGTWLSPRTGAAAGAPGTFAELGDVGGHYLDAATWRDLNSSPETVCLNYAAANSTLLPVGMTFHVTYTLFFNAWSSAVTLQTPP